MAQTVCVLPPAEDRKRLLAIVADRNRPLKHVRRAHIVLCSADCLPVQEVARRARVSRPAVWRWQARYAEQGVEGLLRDKTRKPGRAPLSAKVVAKVLDLTCSEPPGQATHWTGRAMAKAVGVSLRAVQRLWEAHRLQPHPIRTFKRSNDPEFAEKVEDIVGLYMDPPKHAVVVSIDEKSQIQALDRTQPGLPLKPGKCGTMTHDYKRNGATTLFAALNILDGTVIGRCMRRHRHQEFIRFLNGVERAVPAGKIIHAIVDNYAAQDPAWQIAPRATGSQEIEDRVHRRTHVGLARPSTRLRWRNQLRQALPFRIGQIARRQSPAWRYFRLSVSLHIPNHPQNCR